MRRLIAAAALVAAITLPATSETVEISQACFPGFCVESKLPFIAISRDPAKQHYRLREYRSEATIYIQAGEAPAFPHCAPVMCRTETEDGELRAFHVKTGRLLGRLIGPVETCGAEMPERAKPLMVNLYVYIPTVDLMAFTITRKCR